MECYSYTIACFIISLLVYNTKLSIAYKDFSVTSYGAVSGGTKDNTKAFLAAWDAACKFDGESNFVIPQGIFLVGALNFQGPCNGELPPSVNIQGALKFLSNSHKFSEDSWIKFEDLKQLNIIGSGSLDGQGTRAWPINTCSKSKSCQMLPTMLSFAKVNNSRLSGISLKDSTAFHIKFRKCDHFNVTGIRISAPENSPNTDGIHLSISDHISIMNSVIGTGDDCISIGPGSTNVLVSNVTCGPGHGISVGSLGKDDDEQDVIGLQVKNCTFNNTDNGVRIKTWPGSSPSRAANFTFQDLVMVNVTNPIIIDQEYCPLHHCTKEPSKVEIGDVTFKRIRGTSNTNVAVKLQCSEEVPCKNVQLHDIYLSCSGRGCNTISSCSSVHGISSGIQIPASCIPESP